MRWDLEEAGFTPTIPITLTKGYMFDLAPYEKSLVVISMDSPKIKDVLERGYRNWWWYNNEWYDPLHR